MRQKRVSRLGIPFFNQGTKKPQTLTKELSWPWKTCRCPKMNFEKFERSKNAFDAKIFYKVGKMSLRVKTTLNYDSNAKIM